MTTSDIQLSYLERKNGLQEVRDLIIKPCSRSSEVLPSSHPFRRAKQQGQVSGGGSGCQGGLGWAKNGAIPPRLALSLQKESIALDVQATGLVAKRQSIGCVNASGKPGRSGKHQHTKPGDCI